MNIEKYAKYHPKSKPGVLLPETIHQIGSLVENSKVLDIGSAEGNTIQWLESLFPDKYYLFGVDLSKTRIEKATSKKINRAEFRVGNAENLPIEDSSIHYVLTSQVIEHVSDDEQMLKEIDRILMPGCRFQIDTVYKKKWAWYFYRSPSGWALDPTHLREYTDIDSFLSKFPQTLIVESVVLYNCYRSFNIIPFLWFLPDWLRVLVPGYYTLFVLGRKL